MKNIQLEKYLRTRAVTGPWQIEGETRGDFKAAIIIPALAESESLPQTLASLAENPSDYLQQTLILCVINNRADADDSQIADNLQTLAWLQGNPYPQLNLTWVDAASQGLELPDKQGVGLARKIGFDLALALLDWGSEPLLISLDADTLVDKNYLPAIFQHFTKSRCGGATMPFRHRPVTEPLQELAIRRYELYLRSYLFGLQQVDSLYAYHTIGSAFACRAAAYVAAGGMNRRQAAEDFYFLQQLAKTSRVEMLVGTVVRPSARFSDRVSFGTGKAVEEQVANAHQPFQFISAESFCLLHQWLLLAQQMIDQPAESVLKQAAELSAQLEELLAELDFVKNWSRLQDNHAEGAQRLQAFHGWFDGLRTRQLLTRLETGQGRPAQQLVAELLEWGGYPGLNRETEQLALLEQLQGVGKSTEG